MTTEIFKQQLAINPEHPQELGILTESSLCWQQDGRERQLGLKDVVGVSIAEGEAVKFPCLLVHAYPKVKADPLPKQKRTLQEYCFTCPNVIVRSQWHRAISNTLFGKPTDAEVIPRHLQIIINPVSGRGQTGLIFERVRPLFDRSNLKYTVTETVSAIDTQNVVRELDLSKIDGLVIVGGDGTIHNAIAGLMSRSDSETAIKTPLGIIPGGTGNGLSKTLLESSNEIYDPLNAAFLIAKGKQQPLDIAAIKQNNTQYYSFLSLAWGLVSDIDIKSEKLKFLGSWRFDLYALWSICLLRTYKGKFSFIPHSDCKLPPERIISQQGKWRVIEDEFYFMSGQ